MCPLDLGSSPGLGLSPRYLWFSRGVGLETRPSPIHPTPGMNVASLVCDLASLSVQWRHGEWAPFPGYPLTRGLRRSPAAPPPPPHPESHLKQTSNSNPHSHISVACLSPHPASASSLPHQTPLHHTFLAWISSRFLICSSTFATSCSLGLRYCFWY